MNFNRLLEGKILDPIHGTIRITEIECKVIDHPLFQRLRNVKQNSFLYKVFPSAMHSRFEHSLGVMHVAYNMFENLILNSYRYNHKYDDNLLFRNIDKIPNINIQELRLAALLHDVGHGPMSHQFDSFLMSKTQLIKYLGSKYEDIYKLIHGENDVEHEHISLLFIIKILEETGVSNEVNIDNVLSLIEPKYKVSKILIECNGNEYNILPLFTSLISSSPIDSDRMDYLLRDSYFSGVKCGIYNAERLLMSVIPVVIKEKVCLAFKESSLDSISEFVFARMNLFSQVYFHKTNRSFSAMLSKALSLLTDKEELAKNLYNLEADYIEHNIEILQNFYLDNSDDYFLNETVPKLLEKESEAEELLNDIISRKPWVKLYEDKLYITGTIHDSIDRNIINEVKADFEKVLNGYFRPNQYFIDIMTDNAFKDIEKTEVHLLVKYYDGTYKLRDISNCGDKLNIYQSLRYFIRVFVSSRVEEKGLFNIQKELNDAKCKILK